MENGKICIVSSKFYKNYECNDKVDFEYLEQFVKKVRNFFKEKPYILDSFFIKVGRNF